jgi:hypothetical protein
VNLLIILCITPLLLFLSGDVCKGGGDDDDDDVADDTLTDDGDN